jgi:hypothetical protein
VEAELARWCGRRLAATTQPYPDSPHPSGRGRPSRPPA